MNGGNPNNRERTAVKRACTPRVTMLPCTKSFGYPAQTILMGSCPRSLHDRNRGTPSEIGCGVGYSRQQLVNVTKLSASGR